MKYSKKYINQYKAIRLVVFKKMAIFAMLCSILVSCGENAGKKTTNQKNTQEATSSKVLPSADYSSLLINYECDITPVEVAKIFNIPETYVSIAEHQSPGSCAFSLKGFGQNPLGDDTPINLFLEDLGKNQVNKEIKSYLDNKSNNESTMGMGIDLSETGDSYIVWQSVRGMVVIMNANYDNWLVLSYSPKYMYKSRTQEQHDALGEKTIALANYLLKKHKK